MDLHKTRQEHSEKPHLLSSPELKIEDGVNRRRGNV